ncbi:L,D-transpeptidase [Salinimicrobium terrae]|uniref:L,D-transpeptidase n=1 Tax=Salinimicrobium terrae TaxID=470866 RepID=UPI00041BD226|nr:L,D-transpeptidase [Salinimicrobium terrae]
MKDTIEYLFNFFLVILVLSGLSSCDRSERVEKDPDNSIEISTPEGNTTKQEIEELPLLITYHRDSLENSAQVDSFLTRYTEVNQKFIFALNRMDANRLDAGDVLIIPDTLTTDFHDYSPFPKNFEIFDSIPKVVLISRRVQGFALYEHGNLIRWGPVSSGKKTTPTPAGLFYGNHKAVRKVSTVNDAWILPYYFNFMNFEGVGVHEYDMPGYPASHACVRLRNEDAKEIYNWADQWKLDSTRQVVKRNGTPFMVFGEYDFESPVPWLDLAENPDSNYLSADEMKTLRRYVSEYRKDKRNFDPSGIPAEELPVPSEGLETIQ